MEEPKNRYSLLRRWPLLAGIALSVVLSWFAVSQYRMAIPVAQETLRGLALSLSAAVEAVAAGDPSLRALRDFQTPDIAYFAVIDRNGTILFHSNHALIGSKTPDQRFAAVFDNGKFSGARVRLGTGEEIYESNSPLHVQGRTLALRLALHTYRADSVIRRARVGTIVLFSLILAAWIMGFLLNRFAVREEVHKLEMARREQLARMGEMGAVIAHEIRNPLAGIKGYAQLLQEKLEPGEDGQSAGLIVREAVRLEEMVNELLAYSRSDRTTPVPVSVHEALNHSLAVITPEALAMDIIIELSIDESLTIAGIPDRLEQLFLNLFRNALQAMPDGGMLRVTAQRVKSSVEILVADTGQGIQATNPDRIFEPFFTTKARGTGLGLAVCKRITEDCHGDITVESRSGEGTTFRIIFPLYAAS
jgi:two-component system sensor histidine kinase HydH